MPSCSMRAVAEVVGPLPFCPSGGNLRNGRTRTAMDRAGRIPTPSSGGWIMFGKHSRSGSHVYYHVVNRCQKF